MRTPPPPTALIIAAAMALLAGWCGVLIGLAAVAADVARMVML